MNDTPSRRRAPSFSRRRFLRGLGACLALPAFESLGAFRAYAGEPAVQAAAGAAGAQAPVRAAFLFFPNGAIPSAWWPEGAGSEFKLGPTLAPLEPLRHRIQVMGGLDHRNAEAGPDGAGDHARGGGTFLTGVRLKKSASDLRAGVSIDQVIAREVGHQTRLPSLELSCDAVRKSGACDSGYACAYQYNLSWSSPETPMTPEANPRIVFERLFGGGPPGQRTESLKRRQQEQRSVLDFVLEDARSLKAELGAGDREKLDQYLTGIRSIEATIEKAEKFGLPKDSGAEAPPGIPPDYGAYIQLMADLLVLAFQTDSTRVATFLLAHDGSNRSFGDIGISEGHHDLSHHQNREEMVAKVARIDRWYAEQFAQILQKLEAVKDADGNSILYNSMIVYGGGNADANRHTHSNLPIVLAGAGGGTLHTGRFVKHGSKPATNLFLSMADRMGVRSLERFGDSTGRLGDV